MAIEKRKRADGSISYRVRLEGKDGAGNRSQGDGKTFDNRRDAETYQQELKRGRRLGHSVTQSKQPYGDFLKEWLDDKALTARRTTCSDYAFLCRRHIVPALGRTPLAQITHKQLQTFLNQKARTGRLDGQGGLSRARVATLRTILHDSLTTAVRWTQLHVNPAEGLTIPRATRAKEQKSWTAEQVATFLAATERHPYAALWVLAFTAGLRRGELLGLHWRDVDLDGGMITIRETWVQVGSAGEDGEPKSDKGLRRLSLGPRALAALQDHYGQQCEYKSGTKLVWEEHDLVFPNEYGRAMHPTSLTHMFRRLEDRLGLPRIRLHDSRGTSATLTLASGTDIRTVSDRLGHARTTTTMELYIRSRAGADRQAADNLEAAIWPEG